MSRTSAATAARKINSAARVAVQDPTRVGQSIRIVGAALAAGIITPEAIERARQLAASAPVPDPETVARLRALLGVTVAPTRAVIARGARGTRGTERAA